MSSPINFTINNSSSSMDAQHLSSITADAVATVFFYIKEAHSPLADIYKRTIEDAVENLFPLRQRARDTDVAYLEIACDASVTCAEKFNELNPEQTINTRWIYHCVQSLLSLRLKPNLMLDGKVDRLSIPTIDGHPESQADFFRLSPASSVPSPISSSVATPSQTSEVAIETWGISDLEDDNNNKNNGRNSNITVEIPVKKEPKTPWSDEDIERMIELKDLEGLTHEEVANRIGRGKGSVENKYGRVVKEDRWGNYAKICRARYRSRRGTKRRARHNDPDGNDDNDDDIDDDAHDNDYDEDKFLLVKNAGPAERKKTRHAKT